ncbi:hypothetical protein CMUS01_07972 [Colletotrichum musicola]|uniref:Uncharacterized protein n=1 Tax=Colletotrichum musicola TaxID=2175873 RepID=A0A8H6NES0_9PEZI|nr:hypothetical protein CMUS01_07972 [Colletotrichum musicola]
MHPTTPGPIWLQPFKWSRPTTTRESDTSKVDRVLSTQRHHSSGCAEQLCLLSVFLDDFPKSSRLRCERPVFERIFPPGKLEAIRDGDFDGADGLAVWLRDVDQDNKPRDSNGLMTNMQLHHYTSLRRINEKDMVDALRRRIYIPNPSPVTLGILAFRSSNEQNQSMRSMIYKHLEADTDIGLTSFGLEGSREFSLEFHVRSQIWRSGDPFRPDKRLTSSGEPLRQAKELSFFSTSRDGKNTTECRDFLYESHISICVTGWNTAEWTAICLVDSYYDDDTDEDEPLMLSHYLDEGDLDSPPCDALSLGELVSDEKVPKDPREYFLLVCALQLKRISEEWRLIEFQLKTNVRPYLDRPPLPLKRQRTTLGNVNEDCENVEASEMWCKETSGLITTLTSSLDTIVRSVDRFVERHFHRIDDREDPELSYQLRSSVTEIMGLRNQLDKIQDGLKALQSEVKTFQEKASIFELHLAVDSNRAIVLQHWNVTI